jgi:hypothetical protein
MTEHGRRIPLAPQSPDAAGPGPTSAHATADTSESRPDPMPAEGLSAGMTRRSALQGLAAGLGFAVGTPADELQHPLASHVAQRPRPTKPATAAAPRKPQFFDAHQFATLTLVSELIVPGSVGSGSPAYIDDVLAVEHDEVRRTVVNALAAVDAAARDAHGKTFRSLTATQQPFLLESLTAPLTTLKSWVAGAHYSSEAGMKELGFTGNVFFQSFPACTHAEGHE